MKVRAAFFVPVFPVAGNVVTFGNKSSKALDCRKNQVKCGARSGLFMKVMQHQPGTPQQ